MTGTMAGTSWQPVIFYYPEGIYNSDYMLYYYII